MWICQITKEENDKVWDVHEVHAPSLPALFGRVMTWITDNLDPDVIPEHRGYEFHIIWENSDGTKGKQDHPSPHART